MRGQTRGSENNTAHGNSQGCSKSVALVTGMAQAGGGRGSVLRVTCKPVTLYTARRPSCLSATLFIVSAQSLNYWVLSFRSGSLVLEDCRNGHFADFPWEAEELPGRFRMEVVPLRAWPGADEEFPTR